MTFAIRRPVVPAWPRRASGSEQQEFDVRVEPRSGPMFRESPSAAPQELALETCCSRLRGDSSDQDGADPSDALSFRCAGCSSVTICGWQRLRGESFRLHTGFLGLAEGLAYGWVVRELFLGLGYLGLGPSPALCLHFGQRRDPADHSPH